MVSTGRWMRCTRWCSSTPINVKIRDGNVANRPIYVALGCRLGAFESGAEGFELGEPCWHGQPVDGKRDDAVGE